jgi:hypothetical protein
MVRSRANALFLLLLVLAIGCRHEVASSHTPPPPLAQLALSGITLAFTTDAGQTSRAQTVVLTNTGTAALALSSITLGDTANYAMTSTCAASLAASASCTVIVTFKPQSAADLPSTIIITDNDPQTPHTINLHGTGTTGTNPTPSTPAPTS